MRLTIRILGTEVFHFDTDAEYETEAGDCTTAPMGFTASPVDQRYRFVEVEPELGSR